MSGLFVIRLRHHKTLCPPEPDTLFTPDAVISDIPAYLRFPEVDICFGYSGPEVCEKCQICRFLQQLRPAFLGCSLKFDCILYEHQFATSTELIGYIRAYLLPAVEGAASYTFFIEFMTDRCSMPTFLRSLLEVPIVKRIRRLECKIHCHSRPPLTHLVPSDAILNWLLEELPPKGTSRCNPSVDRYFCLHTGFRWGSTELENFTEIIDYFKEVDK